MHSSHPGGSAGDSLAASLALKATSTNVSVNSFGVVSKRCHHLRNMHGLKWRSQCASAAPAPYFVLRLSSRQQPCQCCLVFRALPLACDDHIHCWCCLQHVSTYWLQTFMSDGLSRACHYMSAYPEAARTAIRCCACKAGVPHQPKTTEAHPNMKTMTQSTAYCQR